MYLFLKTMSQELLKKTKTLIHGCFKLVEPHELIKYLIEINKILDALFDDAIRCDTMVHAFSILLKELNNAILHYYMHSNNEIHNVRGNIIASTSSLLFISESKSLLLINDEEWCHLDQYYREKSCFFNKEDFFNQTFFQNNDIKYHAKHPLVQYSMGECRETLFDILLSTKKYDCMDSYHFVEKLFQAVRNRIAIISNYAYSQEINDISEYTVRINNNRAIPTSAFLYDFCIMCREIERNLFCFNHFKNVFITTNYADFLQQVKPTFLKWCSKMILTASGDDFCALFGKFYCQAHVKHFEELLYRRRYPNVNIVHYKLLQTTRGMEEANRIMQTGNDFVVDLLKREVQDDDDDQDSLDLENPDSMCSDEIVLERMMKLNRQDFKILIMGIVDYVSDRQWNRPLHSFFTRTLDPNVTLEPLLLHDPISNKIILFTKSQPPVAFDLFHEAFSGFCYHLQRDYEGILYNKENGEKKICTLLLKKMFSL